jgi:hypothetical protein
MTTPVRSGVHENLSTGGTASFTTVTNAGVEAIRHRHPGHDDWSGLAWPKRKGGSRSRPRQRQFMAGGQRDGCSSLDRHHRRRAHRNRNHNGYSTIIISFGNKSISVSGKSALPKYAGGEAE